MCGEFGGGLCSGGSDSGCFVPAQVLGGGQTGLSEDACGISTPCLALSLAPPGCLGAPPPPPHPRWTPGSLLSSTLCSIAPQVPGAFGISILCLLFIKGMKPHLRNTNGSGSGGDHC